ncbi:hypothetical protein FRC17_009873 [Serendipita sp. 399]|nr:hypothetical protein FRC17_009873 [Serendipita sp. 399]
MLRTSVSATVRNLQRSAIATGPSKLQNMSSVSTGLAKRPYSSGSIHDNDPEILEAEKQKNLKNEQHLTSTPHKHAPGWNEYLASTSEAYTKADKATGTISELQEETVDHIKKRHPVTATETVVNAVSDTVEGIKEAALTAKDTILGPLGSAGKSSSSSVDHKERGSRSAKARLTPDSTNSEAAVKADRGEAQ